MIYLELFLVYFQIGLFAFGGGYAAMPLIQNLVVEGKGWLTMAEFADLTTIAEMTPGPIAVNSATFVGQKMAGLPGAIVCTLGCILPSLFIVLTLAYFYTKYRNLETVKRVLNKRQNFPRYSFLQYTSRKYFCLSLLLLSYGNIKSIRSSLFFQLL